MRLLIIIKTIDAEGINYPDVLSSKAHLVKNKAGDKIVIKFESSDGDPIAFPDSIIAANKIEYSGREYHTEKQWTEEIFILNEFKDDLK